MIIVIINVILSRIYIVASCLPLSYTMTCVKHDLHYGYKRNRDYTSMKKIIIAVVAVLLLVIISPQFIGQLVENEHQSMLSNLNKQMVTVKSTQFNRTWFGGNAKTEVTVHANNPSIDDFSLTINENFSFGPVIFADDGIHLGLSYSEVTLDLGLENDEKATAFLNNNIHLTWLLTFSRHVKTYIKVDEYQSDLGYKKVVVKPAVGQFTMTADNRLYGDFSWQGLNVVDDNEITLQGVSFVIDQKLIRGTYLSGDAVTTGDFSLAIEQVQLAEPNQAAALKLKGISIKATASEIENLLQLGLNYHIASLDLDDQHFEQANLAIQLERLDIETMQAFSKIASTLEDKNKHSQEVMEKLMALGSKLIAKEPRLTIQDASVLTPQGKIEMTATAQFDQTQFDPQNMMTAMMALQVNARATAPVAFFADGAKKQAVDMYLQQGLLIKDGELLKTQLSFKAGKLTVNDKVIPM